MNPAVSRPPSLWGQLPRQRGRGCNLHAGELRAIERRFDEPGRAHVFEKCVQLVDGGLIAFLDNERLALCVAPSETPEIAFVLIAGLVARRIVCPVYEGQLLAAGERIGLIRFGSRVDVYLPLDAEVKAALGDKVYAAESVLAWLTPPNTKQS